MYQPPVNWADPYIRARVSLRDVHDLLLKKRWGDADSLLVNTEIAIEKLRNDVREMKHRERE